MKWNTRDCIFAIPSPNTPALVLTSSAAGSAPLIYGKQPPLRPQRAAESTCRNVQPYLRCGRCAGVLLHGKRIWAGGRSSDGSMQSLPCTTGVTNLEEHGRISVKYRAPGPSR